MEVTQRAEHSWFLLSSFSIPFSAKTKADINKCLLQKLLSWKKYFIFCDSAKSHYVKITKNKADIENLMQQKLLSTLRYVIFYVSAESKQAQIAVIKPDIKK